MIPPKEGGQTTEGSAEQAKDSSASAVGSDTLAKLTAQLQSLQEQLNNAQATIGRQGEELGALRSYKRAQEDTEVDTEQQEQSTGEQLVTQKDVDEFYDNPAGTLNKILQKARDATLVEARKTVGNALAVAEYRRRIVDTFYGANPDLVPHSDLVGLVSAKVQQEHPDALPHTLLEEVAKKTRAYLSSLRGGSPKGTVTGSDSSGGRAQGDAQGSPSNIELSKTLAFLKGK